MHNYSVIINNSIGEILYLYVFRLKLNFLKNIVHILIFLHLSLSIVVDDCKNNLEKYPGHSYETKKKLSTGYRLFSIKKYKRLSCIGYFWILSSTKGIM